MTNRQYIEISAEESFLRSTAFTSLTLGIYFLADFFYVPLKKLATTNTFTLAVFFSVGVILGCSVFISFFSSLSLGTKMRKRSFIGFSFDDEYLNYVERSANVIASYAISVLLGLTYLVTKAHLDTTWGITVSLNDYVKLAIAIMAIAYATPVIFLLWKKDE